MSYFRSILLNGVSFTQLDGRPQQLSPQNFTNYNLQVPSRFQGIVPGTLATVFNYIVSKVDMNVLRKIHYNITVSNNGSNPELPIIATLVLNYAAGVLSSNPNANLEQVIMNIIPQIVDDRLNFVVINSPELLDMAAQYVDSIRQSAERYVQTITDVEIFMASTYSNQTVNLGGQPSFNNGNNGNQGGNFGGSHIGFGGSNSNMNGGNRNQGNNIGSVFERTSNGQPIAKINDRFGGGIETAFAKIAPKQTEKYVDKFEEKSRPAIGLSTASPSTNNTPASRKIVETNLEWAPSNEQSFKFAYFKHTAQSYYRLSETNPGVVLCIIKRIDMDRSEHALPVAEKFLAGNKSIEQREKQIDEMLQTASNAQAAVSEMSKETYVERLNDTRNSTRVVFNGNFSCIDEAVANTREAQLAFTKNPEGIYFSEFNLAEYFPVLEEDLELFSTILAYRTHEELSNFLKFAIGNTQYSATLRRSFVQLNFKLARNFIEFLCFYLSIKDYSNSDSYMEDAVSIIADIEQTYGKSFGDRIRKLQSHFFDLYLNFANSKKTVKSDIAERVANDNDETAVAEGYKRVAMLEFKTPTLLLCTEFTSNEYGLMVSSDVGNNLNSKLVSKTLLDLVHNMVKGEESKGMNQYIKRFFLVTLDGVKYELNCSVVDDKSPLVIIKR